MAIYNEILVGRYARMLQKLLGIKGTVPAKQLGGEVMAILPLFNGAENRYLESWDRFQSSNFQGAVAAQPSTIRIRNPVGSNIMAVLERAYTIGDLAAQDQLIFERSNIAGFNTDLATVIATSFGENLDPRSSRQRSLVISTQAAAGQSANMVQVASGVMAANTSFDLIITDIQEIPLLPGSAVQFRRNTVNTALTACWMWRERLLEESERT